MKYLSLLALVSASVVSAQTLNRSFTINLLTGDQYLSVVKLPLENQTPIGFGNATIQTVYNEITYSVVGSFDFTELNIGQAFHIDNDLWSVDINMSLAKASDDNTVMSQDVIVGKHQGSENEFGFIQMPSQIPGVNLVMPQENRVDKLSCSSISCSQEIDTVQY